MRLFGCQNCSQILFFENDHCENCKKRLGYVSELSTLSVAEPVGKLWRAWAAPERRYRFCANSKFDACNWLIADDGSDGTPDQGEAFCAACRHNRVIPDLSVEENLVRWRKIELAKHHLFYSLIKLGLPLANRVDEPETGLAFDFLTETPTQSEPVMTGHDHGLITLNLAEADDGYREQLRQQMGEPYRTLLGHFRHEVGHYFWDVLVDRGGKLDAFREQFGDERPDYGEALKEYYAQGPAKDWQLHYVSAYASSHPWEDFAETWAHYLHIIDTLEMAGSFGLRIQPAVEGGEAAEAELHEATVEADDIRALIDAWIPVTIAVNSLNRCMGQPDLYPFVLSDAVVAKLGFIHELVRSGQTGSAQHESPQPASPEPVDAQPSG